MTTLKQTLKPIGRNLRDLMLYCGVGPTLDRPDRRLHEQTLFPYLLDQPDLQRILFVGCHWYTWHYAGLFREREFWTLEIDPRRARYGSDRHITDSVANVTEHFEPGSLDAVLMLGVIGYGLDDVAVADRSIAGCFECLRPGGKLILAWDDTPEHLPFPIASLASLQQFEPWVFPPLGTAVYRTPAQDPPHDFGFYRKPGE
ncbi:MAG: hypothetical protein AAGI68_04010 [Planctomycetota bacterium]